MTSLKSMTKAQLITQCEVLSAEVLRLKHEANNQRQHLATQPLPLFPSTSQAHYEWLAYVKETRIKQRAEGRRVITYMMFNDWLNAQAQLASAH